MSKKVSMGQASTGGFDKRMALVVIILFLMAAIAVWAGKFVWLWLNTLNLQTPGCWTVATIVGVIIFVIEVVIGSVSFLVSDGIALV